MLYVNLIEERLQTRARLGAVKRYGSLGLVVLAGVFGFLLFLQFLHARDLRHKIDTVNAEIKTLEPVAETCKGTIVQLVGIGPLWRLADGVVISQQTWGMTLRALSECRPASGLISLESLDSHALEKEKSVRITLRGMASSEFAISDYQTALNRYASEPDAPPLFDSSTTKLIEVSSANREGWDIKAFGLEIGLAPGQGGTGIVSK